MRAASRKAGDVVSGATYRTLIRCHLWCFSVAYPYMLFRKRHCGQCVKPSLYIHGHSFSRITSTVLMACFMTVPGRAFRGGKRTSMTGSSMILSKQSKVRGCARTSSPRRSIQFPRDDFGVAVIGLQTLQLLKVWPPTISHESTGVGIRTEVAAAVFAVVAFREGSGSDAFA